mmetsp:Transcript_79926/g.222660  ORF Transcript_79926/g.222660 Transcript_79926/m.222660 type:complete len:772 (-) Transcript_79926:188-2503(-)
MGSRWSQCHLPSKDSGIPIVQGDGRYVYVVEASQAEQLGATSDTPVNITLVGSQAFLVGVLSYHHSVELHSDEWLGDIGAVMIQFASDPTYAASKMRKIMNSADFGSLIRDPATMLNLDTAVYLAQIQVDGVGENGEKQTWSFPMYRWFSVRDSTFCGVAYSDVAYLPQHTPEYIKHMRQLDLSSCAKLPWTLPLDGRIPCVADQPLPLEQAFNDAKAGDLARDSVSLVATMVDATLVSLKHKLLQRSSSFPDFDSFQHLYNHNKFGTPWRYENDAWRRDDVWGAALLLGPAAGSKYLSKLVTLPSTLAHLTDAKLRGPSGAPHPYLEGTTLQAELVAGRLFLVEHPTLRGMSFSDEVAELLGGKYLAERGICVVRARPSAEQEPFAFLPLCIVLEPGRGEDAPVFLPSDAPYDWLIAKCFIMNASAQCHQIGTHFMESHAASEPVCIATYTKLSYLHPMRRFLMPHVNFTLAINGNARSGLIAAGSAIERGFSLGPHAVVFSEERAKKWSSIVGKNVEPDGKSFSAAAWEEWQGFYDLPALLEQTGLDSEVLEVFPWREDATRLWDAQSKWIRSYVDLYYASDVDVAGDEELGAWVKEVVAGLGTPGPSAPMAAYREAARSKNALVRLVQCFVFQVSVVHAFRNFGQYDYYGFPPFMPVNMRKPPPTTKGQYTTEAEFLDAMPEVENTGLIVGNLILLSDYSSGDQFLGHPEVNWLRDPKVLPALQAYRAELDQISSDVQKRNARMKENGLRHFEYTYLDPKVVPTSVAI